MWSGDLKWRLTVYLFKGDRTSCILLEYLFTHADPNLRNGKDLRLKLWCTSRKYHSKGMNSYFPQVLYQGTKGLFYHHFMYLQSVSAAFILRLWNTEKFAEFILLNLKRLITLFVFFLCGILRLHEFLY